MTKDDIPDEILVERVRALRKDAEAGGYILNPDDEFVRRLVKGICVNEKRYGYAACPCRLATGRRDEDRDIICPCDYRDADLEEHGACYCALYVSPAVAAGERSLSSIPERRPPRKNRARSVSIQGERVVLSLPVWRCRVCGYLCARETPPLVCPICKVSQDRFERFL
ncbi:MAG: ferredoxin:glutaredoxin reductase [Methanolinea sp.]|nr:ferredoxin:glutaredoxin reductase [Methanolinea sp.]